MALELWKQNQLNMNEETVFYMNYLQGGSGPTFKFINLEDAEKEAARLAHNHQTDVFTLKAIEKTAPIRNVEKTSLKENTLPAHETP